MDMKELVGNVLRLNRKDSTGGVAYGCIHSLEWNTGLEHWTGILE